MPLNPKEVMKRADLAQRRSDQWRNLYEECYEFALPQRNLYDGHYEGKTVGQPKMERVFDSTAINSTQRFANRLQSTLFPPYRNWCRLMAGNDIAEEQRDELQAALDIYNEKMFSIIRQTNFDLAMSEFLLDLAVGTGVMLIQPGDDEVPVRFQAVPPFLVAVEEGPHGSIQNVYRKLKMRVEAVPQQWGDLKVSTELQQIIDDKPTDDIELLEATIYVPDEEYYCYHVIWPEKQQELVYRELDSSPWVVSRFSKTAGENLGRGPLVSALPDIKTLNLVKKLILQNASLSISGVYTAADDGVLNPATVKIQPGAIIPVARNGGPQGEALRPLPRAGDFNVAQIVINDLTMSIKKMLLDDTLPPDNMSARSATEINAKLTELAQNLGSAFGRLITEAMTPIVQRTLAVMDQQRLIDLPLRVDGQQVKIVPVSPLAQAQNNEELQSVLQFMQLAQSMGPAGQIAINQDKAIAFMADRLGVPGSILNSREEREAIMAQMAQEAEQAMMQQAEMEAPVE